MTVPPRSATVTVVPAWMSENEVPVGEHLDPVATLAQGSSPRPSVWSSTTLTVRSCGAPVDVDTTAGPSEPLAAPSFGESRVATRATPNATTPIADDDQRDRPEREPRGRRGGRSGGGRRRQGDRLPHRVPADRAEVGRPRDGLATGRTGDAVVRRRGDHDARPQLPPRWGRRFPRRSPPSEGSRRPVRGQRRSSGATIGMCVEVPPRARDRRRRRVVAVPNARWRPTSPCRPPSRPRLPWSPGSGDATPSTPPPGTWAVRSPGRQASVARRGGRVLARRGGRVLARRGGRVLARLGPAARPRSWAHRAGSPRRPRSSAQRPLRPPMPPWPTGIASGIGFAARAWASVRRPALPAPPPEPRMPRPAPVSPARVPRPREARLRPRIRRLATSSAPVRRRAVASRTSPGETNVPTGRGRRIGAMSAARIIPPAESTDAPVVPGADTGFAACGGDGGPGGASADEAGGGSGGGLRRRCRRVSRPRLGTGRSADRRGSRRRGLVSARLLRLAAVAPAAAADVERVARGTHPHVVQRDRSSAAVRLRSRRYTVAGIRDERARPAACPPRPALMPPWVGGRSRADRLRRRTTSRAIRRRPRGSARAGGGHATALPCRRVAPRRAALDRRPLGQGRRSTARGRSRPPG